MKTIKNTILAALICSLATQSVQAGAASRYATISSALLGLGYAGYKALRKTPLSKKATFAITALSGLFGYFLEQWSRSDNSDNDVMINVRKRGFIIQKRTIDVILLPLMISLHNHARFPDDARTTQALENYLNYAVKHTANSSYTTLKNVYTHDIKPTLDRDKSFSAWEAYALHRMVFTRLCQTFYRELEPCLDTLVRTKELEAAYQAAASYTLRGNAEYIAQFDVYKKCLLAPINELYKSIRATTHATAQTPAEFIAKQLTIADTLNTIWNACKNLHATSSARSSEAPFWRQYLLQQLNLLQRLSPKLYRSISASEAVNQGNYISQRDMLLEPQTDFWKAAHRYLNNKNAETKNHLMSCYNALRRYQPHPKPSNKSESESFGAFKSCIMQPADAIMKTLFTITTKPQ